MKYYISRSGQQYGPYTLADIENLLAQGQIEGTDHAWAEGMAAWTPVSEILAQTAAGAAPAAPAPEPAPAATPAPPVQRAPTMFEPPPTQAPPPQFEPPPQYPPQPQFQPQPFQQAAPPFGVAPAAAMAAPMGPGAMQPVGAIPPKMHWFLLLILGCLTGGILMWVWMFIQAGFAKRLDPNNKSSLWLTLWLVCTFATFGVLGYAFYEIFSLIHFTMSDLQDPQFIKGLADTLVAYFQANVALLLIYCICAPLSWVFVLVGIFTIRGSVQRYYNNVEPIGLRLSGVMTFFFHVLYFQYHFRRIARWKETGQLS